MPTSTVPRPLLAALALLPLLVGLTACGGSDSAGSSTTVDVSAGDDSCEVSETDLPAGDITFAVQNEGSKVTEVYVYAKSSGDDFTKVVSEVENIGPGTGRDMDVDLAAGTYEIACKPGQQGDGIRQQIEVSGAGGGSSDESSEEGYDREIELSVDDSGLAGLDPATAKSGERIEFKLENSTDATRTLEVVDPAGDVAAEFDVPAGDEGEAVVELGEAGDWTVKVEGGTSDIEQTLTVS
jgi:uncharacterized cupredoxin-like copper-binding protein